MLEQLKKMEKEPSGKIDFLKLWLITNLYLEEEFGMELEGPKDHCSIVS
jgi:hypothetical protein